MQQTHFAIACALTAALVAGCDEGQPCTLVECGDAITVTVASRSGALTGAVDVTVAVGEARSATMTCPPSDESSGYTHLNFAGGWIEGRCSLDAGSGFVLWNGVPHRERLSVTVSAASGEAFAGPLDVAVSADELNGPGCGTCASGAAQIVLQ